MQQQTVEKRVYTVEETSRLFGLSQQTVRRAIATGDLPAVKIGRQYFIPCAAVERLLAGQNALPAVSAGDE